MTTVEEISALTRPNHPDDWTDVDSKAVDTDDISQELYGPDLEFALFVVDLQAGVTKPSNLEGPGSKPCAP